MLEGSRLLIATHVRSWHCVLMYSIRGAQVGHGRLEERERASDDRVILAGLPWGPGKLDWEPIAHRTGADLQLMSGPRHWLPCLWVWVRLICKRWHTDGSMGAAIEELASSTDVTMDAIERESQFGKDWG